MEDPTNTPLPVLPYLIWSFYVTGTSVRTEIRRKKGPLRPTFQGHASIYDFLLVHVK